MNGDEGYEESMNGDEGGMNVDEEGMKGDEEGMNGDKGGMNGDQEGMNGYEESMNGDEGGMNGDEDGMNGDEGGMNRDEDGMNGDEVADINQQFWEQMEQKEIEIGKLQIENEQLVLALLNLKTRISLKNTMLSETWQPSLHAVNTQLDQEPGFTAASLNNVQTIEISHPPIPENIKCKIASKLHQGVAIDKILDDVRDDTLLTGIGVEQLLSRQDMSRNPR